MKEIPQVKANELYCTGCERAKFRGLFSQSDQKMSPGSRRCMECVSKRNKEVKKRIYRREPFRYGNISEAS
jgi:hypothetical protein